MSNGNSPCGVVASICSIRERKARSLVLSFAMMRIRCDGERPGPFLMEVPLVDAGADQRAHCRSIDWRSSAEEMRI
jgi:hypothetical protein